MKRKTKEKGGREQRIAELVRILNEAELELKSLNAGVSSRNDEPKSSIPPSLIEIFSSVLNAMPAHVALLDSDGVIVSINESWQQFSTTNPLQGPNFGIGQNYISLCEQAKADCADEAHQAAVGIRSVLNGSARNFVLEYPCHSETEKRWFRLMVSPLHEAGFRGAVVMHINITLRKLAEEDRQNLIHVLNERVKELRVLHEVANILGNDQVPANDLLAQVAAVLPGGMQYPEAASALVAYGEHKATTPDYCSSPWKIESQFTTTNGISGCVQIVYREEKPEADSGPFLKEEVHLITSLGEMLRAHFERRSAQELLRANEWRLRAIVESEPECVKIVSQDGRVLDMNLAGLRMLEADHKEAVVGHLIPDLIHPEDRDAFWKLHQRSGQGETGQLQFRVIGLKGTERWMETHSTGLRDADGTIRSVLSITRDISARKQAEGALADSQRRLRSILESVGEGIHGLDAEGRVTFDNPAGAAMLGWDEQEMIGQNSHALIHHHRPNGEEYPVGDCPIHQTLRDGKVRQVAEEVFFRKDGSSFPVEYVCSPVRDESGKLAGAVISFRDITERKQAEQRAAEAQKFTQTLVETSPLAIITYRASGEAVTANAASAKMLGAPDIEAVRSQNFRSIEVWKRTGLLAAADAALASGTPRELEIHEVNSFGKEIWLHCRLVPFSYAGERYLLGFFDDIRERKLAEARVQQNQSLVRMASRVSRLGAWQVDLADMSLTWSDEARAIHEVGPDYQLTVDRGIEFYAPEYRETIRELFQACVREGKPFDEELEIITPQGRRVWVRAMGEAVRAVDGTIFRVQGAIQDITDRKQVEEEMRTLAERLTTTLESITDAFFTLDRDWRFTFLNREAERLLARNRAELLGRRVWDEFPEAVGSTFEKEYHRALENHQTIAFEEFFPPLNVWFAVRAYPSEQGLAVYFRDVTASRNAREALEASEERFRELAENIGDIFYNYDPIKNQLLYANPSYEKIWGRSSESIYVDPTSYLDAVHPDDRAAAEGAFQQQLDGRQTSVEFRILRPDGGLRWVHEHAVPILNKDGQVERIVGTMRDITESKLADHKMRESEERFRLLSKATKDAIWDWDLCTNQLWWSENFEAIFGDKLSEIDPTIDSWISRIHSDERDAVVKDVQKAIDQGKESWSGEYRLRRKDGTYAHILDRGYIIRDANGKAVRMIGGLTDLTERKQADARIREQASLLDKARDAILVRDLEHRITYWNKSCERLYGWAAEEVLGKSVHGLIYRDTAEFEKAMETVLAEGEWMGELHQRSNTQRPLIVEGRWTLVRDSDGRPASILAINTDVTEKKKLESQFLRAQRMESIGTLAGGIAHDLNNVLAPVMMSVHMLKMKLPDAEDQELLTTLERGCERGSDLVRQVLSFARGVEGQRVPVNAIHLVNDLLKVMRDTFPKSINVQFKSAANLWTVTGDPTQLHQVFLNLSVNARDAMPDGGTLFISMENVVIDETYAAMNPDSQPGSYLMVKFADTGMGIAPEIQERIFEPFFTTKEMGKGTGLGLSTTMAIVKSHGGFISLYSEIGKGTKFKVYLPANTTEAAASKVAVQQTRLPRGNGELILVVDDEEAIRNVAKRTLERFGYRVMLANNGAEAVSLYARHQKEIALVLTDMAMPIMDGPALIIALKAMNPRVCVVGSSGLTTNDGVAKAVGAGIEHFVPKPYTADAMLTLIKKALNQEAQRSSK